MAEIVSISIETEGVEKISKLLSTATDRIDDWTPIADGIVTMVRDDVRLRFQSSPAVEVGGMVWGDVYWRPLTEGYLLSRPDRQSGQILIDSGALKQSVTEDTAESFTSITSEEIKIGTTLPYAGEMQEKFPFIFWHPILLERIADYLVTWYWTGKEGIDAPQRSI